MTHLEQGDIVEVDFSPAYGHEPAKYRPAVVVSGYGFNSRSSTTAVVPVTTTNNGYPLHFDMGKSPVKGYACVEQLRCLDLSARGYRLVGVAGRDAMLNIMSAIRGMFELK